MIDVKSLLKSKEGENIEFKEAKEKFEFDELAKYACALSNQGGGSIVLGVTDKRPRVIVGTKAFAQPEETRRSLISKLHVNVDFEEVESKDGKRVLVKI